MAALAVLAVAFTALGAMGAVPQLSLRATLGAHAFDAGPFVQLSVAILLLAVLALVPGAVRVRALEARHREFRIGMEDITRAYVVAHAADRSGAFTLAREFDAVRERFDFLRDHPDLADLEPELLDIAAQMSTEARALARIYSDENVARAEATLAARRAEADRLGALIDRAHAVSRDIRRTLAEVEMEEDVLRSRIERLREELGSLWSEIDAPVAGRAPSLRLAAE